MHKRLQPDEMNSKYLICLELIDIITGMSNQRIMESRFKSAKNQLSNVKKEFIS